VSLGQEALVTNAGDFCFFAAWRSDPFFFDAKGLFNKMQFTGDDFFADKNICGLPNLSLGTNEVGLWARTLDKTGEGWSQADRGGRPLQAVFLPGEEREAYLSGEPADDDRFLSVFGASIGAYGWLYPGGFKGRGEKVVVRHSFLRSSAARILPA
jgi:hypothetical protein